MENLILKVQDHEKGLCTENEVFQEMLEYIAEMNLRIAVLKEKVDSLEHRITSLENR